MRNDWPEEDSGVRTAFQFSMPAKVDEMLTGQVQGLGTCSPQFSGDVTDYLLAHDIYLVFIF